MSRRIAAISAIFAIAIAATAYAQEAATGARAPELGLADLDGHQVSIASLRGQVVIIDFWASWCEPCAHSMPFYQRLYTSLHARGLTIVGVSQDTRVANARTFVGQHHLTFPVLHDASHAVAGRYHPGHMPTAFIIDRQGIVRHVHGGFRSADEAAIEAQVRALL